MQLKRIIAEMSKKLNMALNSKIFESVWLSKLTTKQLFLA